MLRTLASWNTKTRPSKIFLKVGGWTRHLLPTHSTTDFYWYTLLYTICSLTNETCYIDHCLCNRVYLKEVSCFCLAAVIMIKNPNNPPPQTNKKPKQTALCKQVIKWTINQIFVSWNCYFENKYFSIRENRVAVWFVSLLHILSFQYCRYRPVPVSGVYGYMDTDVRRTQQTVLVLGLS